jgi:hypothetical protein
VDRFIQLSLQRYSRVDTHFFDAYKLFSKGMMHPKDDRQWAMKSTALSEMNRQMRALRIAIVARRHDHFTALRKSTELSMMLVMGFPNLPFVTREENVEELERLQEQMVAFLSEAENLQAKLDTFEALSEKQQRIRTAAILTALQPETTRDPDSHQPPKRHCPGAASAAL